MNKTKSQNFKIPYFKFKFIRIQTEYCQVYFSMHNHNHREDFGLVSSEPQHVIAEKAGRTQCAVLKHITGKLTGIEQGAQSSKMATSRWLSRKENLRILDSFTKNVSRLVSVHQQSGKEVQLSHFYDQATELARRKLPDYGGIDVDCYSVVQSPVFNES